MPPRPAGNKLDFAHRLDASELMDQPCSYEDFRDCLRDLAQVNFITLAYRPTLTWLKRALARSVTRSAPLQIVDVGCGGGDMLVHIQRWAQARDIAVDLTGIDLNPYAARAARELHPRDSAIRWITGDAFAYQPPKGIDIVISSLFTHHLSGTEIIEFLKWMEENARLGWFINDLHRHSGPYHLFGLLAKAARWHRFVQHDGPVSIQRSFRESDWQDLCRGAGSGQGIRIETFRPGRLCVGHIK